MRSGYANRAVGRSRTQVPIAPPVLRYSAGAGDAASTPSRTASATPRTPPGSPPQRAGAWQSRASLPPVSPELPLAVPAGAAARHDGDDPPNISPAASGGVSRQSVKNLLAAQIKKWEQAAGHTQAAPVRSGSAPEPARVVQPPAPAGRRQPTPPRGAGCSSMSPPLRAPRADGRSAPALLFPPGASAADPELIAGQWRCEGGMSFKVGRGQHSGWVFEADRLLPSGDRNAGELVPAPKEIAEECGAADAEWAARLPHGLLWLWRSGRRLEVAFLSREAGTVAFMSADRTGPAAVPPAAAARTSPPLPTDRRTAPPPNEWRPQFVPLRGSAPGPQDPVFSFDGNAPVRPAPVVDTQTPSPQAAAAVVPAAGSFAARETSVLERALEHEARTLARPSLRVCGAELTYPDDRVPVVPPDASRAAPSAPEVWGRHPTAPVLLSLFEYRHMSLATDRDRINAVMTPQVLDALLRLMQGAQMTKFNRDGTSHRRFFAIKMELTKDGQHLPFFCWAHHETSNSFSDRLCLTELCGVQRNCAGPGFAPHLHSKDYIRAPQPGSNRRALVPSKNCFSLWFHAGNGARSVDVLASRDQDRWLWVNALEVLRTLNSPDHNYAVSAYQSRASSKPKERGSLSPVRTSSPLRYRPS